MGMDRVVKRRKFPIGRVLGAGTIVALIAVFIYQLRVVDKRPLQIANRADIQISAVKLGDFQEYFQVNGYVAPAKRMFIDSRENGIVTRVHAHSGDIVAKGQVLLELQNDDLESARELKEASLNSARQELQNNGLEIRELGIRNSEDLLEIDHQVDLLQSEYDVKSSLQPFGGVSARELQTAEKELVFLRQKRENMRTSQELDLALLEQDGEKVKSSIDIMELDLKRLNARVETLTITSPAYGQITAFDASVGETKAAGQRIAELDTMDKLKIRANLDQYDLPKIAVGDTATFAYQSGTEEKSECVVTLSRISPDVTSNALDVDFTFDGGMPRGLRIGQRLQLSVRIGEKRQATLLAQGPFYQTTGGTWVYVVDPSGSTATKRKIAIGEGNPDYFEVLEGLKPGERVVVSDYTGFPNLDTIRVK